MLALIDQLVTAFPELVPRNFPKEKLFFFTMTKKLNYFYTTIFFSNKTTGVFRVTSKMPFRKPVVNQILLYLKVFLCNRRVCVILRRLSQAHIGKRSPRKKILRDVKITTLCNNWRHLIMTETFTIKQERTASISQAKWCDNRLAIYVL